MSFSNKDCSLRDTATGTPWKKGNVNCNNYKFFSKGCFGDLLAVVSDIIMLAPQLLQEVSANRGVEEAYQEE